MLGFGAWVTAARQQLSAFREVTKEIKSEDHFSSPQGWASLDAAFARCLETSPERAADDLPPSEVGRISTGIVLMTAHGRKKIVPISGCFGRRGRHKTEAETA
jgi:hypothetical protein